MQKRNHFIIVVGFFLLWTIFVKLFDTYLLYSMKDYSQNVKELYDNIINAVIVLFYIFLPIFGVLTDIKFGWLNAAIASACLGAFCSLTCIIVPLAINEEIIVVLVTSVVGFLALIMRIYFEVSILCFATKELIEMSASSDQLSCYIWWRSWGINLANMITFSSNCFFSSHNYYKIYASSIHLILLVMIIVTVIVVKRWTIRYNYSVNPLKLISGVLCFAVKNRYPLNRSALTYWEEIEPSRINLGKEKYGGPFLEKDVESVKTFFRLLPMVLVINMIQFPYQKLNLLSEYVTIKECLLSGTYFIENCVAVVAVPVYHFIIKPLKRMRLSILRKIIIGIALTVVGKFGFVILDLYISIPAYVSNNQTICLLQSPDNDTNFSFDDNIYLYSQVTSNCINSLGVLLAVTCSFEFIFAQAPHSMRGMLIRVWFSIKGIYAISGWMMVKPFKAAKDYLIPSCELYVLIMNFIFMLVSLILSIVLSRRYKLHKNEDVFNPHLIAEMYYENEFNQRDRLMPYGSYSASLNSNR